METIPAKLKDVFSSVCVRFHQVSAEWDLKQRSHAVKEA